MQLMTNSRASCARACQRKHKYRFIDGYERVSVDDALRFGELWHLGQEAWWNAMRTGAMVDDRLALALKAIQAESDPFEKAKVEALLIGYDLRWGNEFFDVIAVEARFEADLRNPQTGHPSRVWRLSGKLDVLLPDAFVEHKTTSENIFPGSDYWRRLRIDGQVSTYFDGSAALGHSAERCIYDVVRKPTIRPLNATPPEARKFTKAGALYAGQRLLDETPEEYKTRILEDIASDPSKYYARGEVVRLEAELAEARFDLWQLAQQIRESELAGRFPRNPGACFNYNRPCEFFGVCTGEESLEDPAKFRRLGDVHPELAA